MGPSPGARAFALLLVLSGCGGAPSGPDLTRPCPTGKCSPGLRCVAVNFEPVCLLEVVDPAAMYPNGDPMCPAGLGGFQTMSGTLNPDGSTTPKEHHALCSPICYRDSQCSWGNKCILVTSRPEAGGDVCGVCLPF